MFRFVNLIRKRSISTEYYRAFQSFIAEKTVNRLDRMGYDLMNSLVLELGSGFGGYSTILKNRTRGFIASDICMDTWYPQQEIPFVQLDSINELPFRKNSFDFIYCSSLIEHIADPGILLANIRRVLRHEGILYLSFPPFYSLSMVGGHQFKPFHFLGEKTAVRLTNLIKKTEFRDYPSAYGKFGLHPLTIDRVRQLLVFNKFKIKKIYSRMSLINTASLPGLLKDLATWHVCFIAQINQ
jgi:SAM-dependent methyltransferase